jgi:hypothetical protein
MSKRTFVVVVDGDATKFISEALSCGHSIRESLKTAAQIGTAVQVQKLPPKIRGKRRKYAVPFRTTLYTLLKSTIDGSGKVKVEDVKSNLKAKGYDPHYINTSLWSLRNAGMIDYDNYDMSVTEMWIKKYGAKYGTEATQAR